MIDITDNNRLLVDMAHMYYNEGAKQNDIAKKFNISRSLVSKHLSKAREIGLIEIIIHDERLHPHRELENLLKKKFGLFDAVCISSDNDSQTEKRIGFAAGEYLSQLVQPGNIIGISAGESVNAFAKCYHPTNRVNKLTFVPLVGAFGAKKSEIQSNALCDILAERTGGSALSLNAPVIVDTVEARGVFMDQSFIKNVFLKARVADIAVIGIGSNNQFVYSTMSYMDKLDYKIDNDKSVAGDVAYNFIDDEGNPIDCDWNNQVLALSVSELRAIPTVIGIAGGINKVRGVLAALKGKIVDVLVTDEKCAEELLKS